MPRLIVTEGAAQSLDRCLTFLTERNPDAAERARQAIARSLRLLTAAPAAGRPWDGASEFRELIIGFGDSGYVTLYRYDIAEDAIHLLAFRHQREAGY